MHAMDYKLKTLLRHSPQGSYGTQKARERNIYLMSRQLREMGYKMTTPKAIKPKHVHALLNRWKDEELSTGTIKNRLGHVRFWAESVGKVSILETNDAYGVPQRSSQGGNRAQKLDMEKVASVDSKHLRMSLRLMSAFGLRREEALKFQPTWSDCGDHIRLKGSWTKGGRERTVPILTKRQRALLDEARDLVGNTRRSLIPEGDSYAKHLKRFENQTIKAGLKNCHGLRHHYAQERYKALTGWECPARGGAVLNKAVDFDARLTIAKELGNGRIDVTATYLGGRPR